MFEGMGVRWVMSRKFIPSLQAALNVCLYYVFGQQCLMGCHSLPRQNYYPTCFSTSFSSIFFSFLTTCSAISDVSLYPMRRSAPYQWVWLHVVYLQSCFFSPSCSVWHICCCLVGRLCSPVINLFCRFPSALCLPPILLLLLLSVAYFFSSSSPLFTDISCTVV